MDHKSSQKQIKILKPSPNEEEAIIRNALAERRKQRLLQVRKQEKNLSGKIRTTVKSKREKEIRNFKLQQQEEWDRKISNEIKELEAEYRKRMESLGEGHKSADEIPVKDLTQSNQVVKQRALQRYEEALKKLAEQRIALKKMEEEKSTLRQKVAKTEQVRASTIASKPPPVQDFVVNIEHMTRQTTLSSRTKGTDSFSSTRFHMPSLYAEKANGQPQVDARDAARDLEERIKQANELLQRDLNERKEKASLRHQYARQQVLLDQSKDRLLEQLDDLEFKDRARRQQILSKIPKQVFQPPYQRIEDAKARQIVLEEAFENAHQPNKDLREEELVLDLEDELEALERDLAHHESLRQENADIQSSAPDAELLNREQTDTSSSAQMAALNPDEQKPGTEQPERPADPSKRMQKLLGRIRQQQDAWSKQNVNRKVDNFSEKDQMGRDESSDSLVSADINSARYTNSNPESTENGICDNKPREEKPLENDICSQEQPDSENSLLHPFEKAKLIRSAGRKQDESVEKDGLTTSLSIDLDKRKKTLENQKYLFKIQKQRLENQLLRRNLQTTEKALGILVEENANSSMQGGFSNLSNHTTEENNEDNEDKTGYPNEAEDRLNELLDNGRESENGEPLNSKTKVETIEEEKHEEDSESSSTSKSISAEDSVEQIGMPFVSGLSDIQRETLSKKYPNIFNGLSFVKTGKEEIQRNVELADVTKEGQEKMMISDHGLSENRTAVPGNETEELTSISPAEESKSAFSHSAKPKIEIERIRRYQEQLLQKQKWLKKRHGVLQKRHEDMLNEFIKSDSKTSDNQISGTDEASPGLLLSEAIGGSQILDTKLARSDIVEPSVDMHERETQHEFETNSTRILYVEGEERHGRGHSKSYKSDIDIIVEEETPAKPQESLREIEQLIDFTGQNISAEKQILDERKEQSRLEEMDDEKVIAMRDGYGVQNTVDLGSGRQSNFDDLETLLSEIDSIHVQANATTTETDSFDPLSTDVLKKSHRIISGKPVFSPIQEVEETTFKERDTGTIAPQVQGTASVSSLTEQALPISSRPYSEASHFSPVRSTKSNERSEISSAFSLRELTSSLSETDYLPLPKHSARNQIPHKVTKQDLTDVNNQRSTGSDTWTPLQPYYSGPKDLDGTVIPIDYHRPRQRQVSNDAAIGGPMRSGIRSDIEFDEEKYTRLIEEHLRLPAALSKNATSENMHHKQIQDPDVVEMASLREQSSDVVEIDELRQPAIPSLSSQKSRDQKSVTSMKETTAIVISSSLSSSSSTVSKRSSTNMSKYEEVLEHVRMLPYKYLEEYNKLSESYESWRKETVEPLLQADISDPYERYETLTKKEHSYESLSPVGEWYSPITTTSNTVYQPLHTGPRSNEYMPHVNEGNRELMASGIQLHEPVLDFHLHGENEDLRSGETDDEEAEATVFAEGTLPMLTSKEPNDNELSLNAISFQGISKSREQNFHDPYFIDKDESLFSDQLAEQKFSEIVDENDSQNDSLYSGRHETTNSAGNGRDNQRIQFNVNEMKAGAEKDMAQSNKEQMEEYDGGLHSRIVERDIGDFDVEAIQRRFLDQYVSSLGSGSSATKSSLTNSSSQKSKSFYSSGLRSDETVSELAQLWSRVSRSTKEDDAEIEESTTHARNFQTRSGSSSGAQDTSTSTSTSSNKVLIKRQESLIEEPMGFKDPNNYDISLYKSTSFKASKALPDAQSLSYKSDDSSHLPTVPKFASTLLPSDQPSSETNHFSSPSMHIQHDLHASLDSNSFDAAVEGHCDTSWLLSSDTLKAHPEYTMYAEAQRSPENILAVVKPHGLGSDESLLVGSKDSPVSSSSHDDRTDDQAIQTWGELLTAQVSGSSAKESDGELPEVLKLKKEAFIRRSQQRVQQNQRKYANEDHQHTRFRVDGRVEKSDRKKADKENKKPTNSNRVNKKTISSSVSGGKLYTGSKSNSSSQSDKQKLKKEDVLHENRRRVQQFQKKIQSSLRSRRK